MHGASAASTVCSRLVMVMLAVLRMQWEAFFMGSEFCKLGRCGQPVGQQQKKHFYAILLYQ